MAIPRAQREKGGSAWPAGGGRGREARRGGGVKGRGHEGGGGGVWWVGVGGTRLRSSAKGLLLQARALAADPLAMDRSSKPCRNSSTCKPGARGRGSAVEVLRPDQDRPGCCKHHQGRITGEDEWWRDSEQLAVHQALLLISKIVLMAGFAFLVLWKVDNWINSASLSS